MFRERVPDSDRIEKYDAISPAHRKLPEKTGKYQSECELLDQQNIKIFRASLVKQIVFMF